MSTILAYPNISSLLLLLLVIGIGLFFVWAAEKSPLKPLLQSCGGVTAPFSSLPALLFGLFSAFLANDVSIHAERARAAVTREANAIVVVLSLADGSGERGRALKQLALDYGRKTTDDGWRSAQQTAETDALGLKMLHEAMFGGLAGVDTPLRQTVTASIMDMRGARSEMMAVAVADTAWLKWIAVFMLGVLTQMAVAAVHIGKPRAAVLAMVLFGTGMAFMLWVVLVRIDPFTGKGAVPLTPISTAYAPFMPR